MDRADDTKVVTSTDSDAVGGVSERLGSSERAMAKADDYARRLHKALGVPLVVVTSTGWREIPPEEIVVDPPIR